MSSPISRAITKLLADDRLAVHALGAPTPHSDACDCPECIPSPSASLDLLETKSPIPDDEALTGAEVSVGIRLDCPQYGDREWQTQPASLTELTFRHCKWGARRAIVWEAMKMIGTQQRKLEHFAECGSSTWLELAPSGDDIRLVSNNCKSRWCEPCMETRAARIRTNLSHHLQDRHVRFLTLTLRHSPTPLADQIDRLFRSFLVLRRRGAWQANVTGGAAFLEVKISERDALWHPHLHIIMEGSYWGQREISAEWHRVTGDSSIVDIRAVTDQETVGKYVTKYVTKPAHESVYRDPNKLQEMMVALRGRRLLTTFGTWRGFGLEAKPAGEEKWKAVGSLEQVLRAAFAGDPESLRYAQAAARKFPHKPWPSWLVPDARPLPDG